MSESIIRKAPIERGELDKLVKRATKTIERELVEESLMGLRSYADRPQAEAAARKIINMMREYLYNE